MYVNHLPRARWMGAKARLEEFMVQLLAAALFSLIALGGLAFLVGTLTANRSAIIGALANRGEAPDAGFVWVARIKRVSRPTPALARMRPQAMRVAA